MESWFKALKFTLGEKKKVGSTTSAINQYLPVQSRNYIISLNIFTIYEM